MKSVLKSNFNDSVEGLKIIVLMPNALSSNNLIADNSSTIFPNPFTEQTIFSCSTELENATLIIYNSLGEKIRVNNNLSGNKIAIDRGDLARGTYILEISEKGNLVGRKKVIVIN